MKIIILRKWINIKKGKNIFEILKNKNLVDLKISKIYFANLNKKFFKYLKNFLKIFKSKKISKIRIRLFILIFCNKIKLIKLNSIIINIQKISFNLANSNVNKVKILFIY